MSEFPWTPLRITFDLDRRLDEAFHDLINRPWGLVSRSTLWQPDIDIYDTDEAYIVEADLPGVSPEKLEIHVEAHAVTISGSRESAGTDRTAHGLRIERRQGEFSRRFHLSHTINPQATEHTCIEGLHRIILRKRSRRSTTD